MTNRNGAHDDDCDMLVIGGGLGGSVVALQLTKKRSRTRLLAVGRRSLDEHFAEAAWDIKRFAWAHLGLKGARIIGPANRQHCGVRVVPMTSAPAARSRSTTSLSKPKGCAVEGDSHAGYSPAMAATSFTAIGTPANASSPKSERAARTAASARASSCRT